MTADDLKEILFPVLDIFQNLGVDYYICGSVAALAWGLKRPVNDIDVVTTLNQTHSTLLKIQLASNYYISPVALDDAVKYKTQPFNIISYSNPIKICVYVSKDTLYAKKCFERKQYVSLTPHSPLQVPIQSAEDVVLQKLSWYQDSHNTSTKQWNDVQQVLVQQTKYNALDQAYLQQWARGLKVDLLLQQALREAGL